jgi:hypothetical protein
MNDIGPKVINFITQVHKVVHSVILLWMLISEIHNNLIKSTWQIGNWNKEVLMISWTEQKSQLIEIINGKLIIDNVP